MPHLKVPPHLLQLSLEPPRLFQVLPLLLLQAQLQLLAVLLPVCCPSARLLCCRLSPLQLHRPVLQLALQILRTAHRVSGVCSLLGQQVCQQPLLLQSSPELSIPAVYSTPCAKAWSQQICQLLNRLKATSSAVTLPCAVLLCKPCRHGARSTNSCTSCRQQGTYHNGSVGQCSETQLPDVNVVEQC